MKFYLIITFFLIFFSCQKEIKNPTTIFKIKDEMGYEINLQKIPERIISSAPNLTEIIYKLKLEDKLIGRTSFCNFPEEVKNKSIVGDLLSINIEKALELKADLILLTVEGNTKTSYEKIKSAGINALVTNPRNLDGINNTIRLIAKIFNKNYFADSLINSFNQRLDSLKFKSYKTSADKQQTCMFLISTAPLMLVGGNTFINEIIEKSGFINIAAKSKIPYPQYSREEILKLNPEFIIIPSVKKVQKEDLLKIYQEWKILKAIKNDNIIVVNPDLFLRPGPRYIDAIEYLSQAYYKKL